MLIFFEKMYRQFLPTALLAILLVPLHPDQALSRDSCPNGDSDCSFCMKCNQNPPTLLSYCVIGDNSTHPCNTGGNCKFCAAAGTCVSSCPTTTACNGANVCTSSFPPPSPSCTGG